MECIRPEMPAVCIRNAHKTFKGSGNKGTVVLRNFSMTVNTGTLYSLIGSSGCGKTTILSALVGVHKLDHGYLTVFGRKSVPVSPSRWQRIGYMPQELSLYTQFSIYETLSYFGALFNTGRDFTSQSYLEGRMQFLRELLSLPNGKRIVGTLSGGEKRRVSFAVALINEPELLLLDEPTSGVDPLVRECIWQHLKFLAAKKGTTIIVTTHYVDEARGSDVVGMMRDGQLIAEEDPSSLMNTYRVDSLEGVFLALCKLQNEKSSSSPPLTTASSSRRMPPSLNCERTVSFMDDRSLKHQKSVFSPTNRVRNSGQRIRALVQKNYRILVRNIWSLLYLLAPAVGLLAACAAMGHFPKNIPLGVVNHDVAQYEQCWYGNVSLSSEDDCTLDRLSCCFLREIPTDILNLKLFPTAEEALRSTKKGETWGFVSFPDNYSTGVTTRMVSGNDYPEDDPEQLKLWNSSQISVRLDQSNSMVRFRIVSVLYQTFEKSAIKILRDYGLDERNGQSPLQFGEPLAGTKDDTALAQIAPGFTMILLMVFPVTVSVRFITEKRQGTMNRCLAAGTQVWEIIAAHFVVETVVLILQSLMANSILFYGFNIGISIFENYLLAGMALALCVLTGLTGISMGLLLGVMCTEEAQAAMIIVAVVLPASFLSGNFWPALGMPIVLQYIALITPLNLPGDALQVMMSTGVDFFHAKVWPGFLVLAVYTFGCNLIIIFRIRSRRVK